MRKYIFFIVVWWLFTGCRNNKEEVTSEVCSTANVSYSGTIAGIINANGCLNCHSGAAPQGGFRLENYDQVKAIAMQTRAGTSLLYGAVSHSNGFSAMPQGLPKLNSCDIAKIKAWIDVGTPQ